MQVKDVMTPIVEVIAPDATLEVAAGRMREMDIGVLPVRSGDTLVGMITDRDIAVRAISQGLDPRTTPVREAMTPGVVSCLDVHSLEAAVSEMSIHRAHRLVVLDRMARLAGVVSLDDVARGADTRNLGGQTLMRVAPISNRADGYRRILVALDGSRLAECVLASVEPIARKFGATITLIRAVVPVEGAAPAELSQGVVSESWVKTDPPATTDEMRVDAKTYLAGIRKSLEARGLTVESDCPEGEASRAILRRARELEADLIAIATHGRTGVDRMVFGSVAEEVLRHTSCPVLIVRAASGEHNGS